MYIGGWSDPDMFDYYTLCHKMMGMPEDVGSTVVGPVHSGLPQYTSASVPRLPVIGSVSGVSDADSKAARVAATAVTLPKL